MEVSIFDIIGPIMIGPSSSHTAGAARLARAARLIADDSLSHVSFGLCGSFAKTYKGHGTDRALLAGVLGYSEQDERIADAFELAKQAGITWDFHEETLKDVHENTVLIEMTSESGTKTTVVGSSVGGGQILIVSVDGFATEMTLRLPTLLLFHRDRKGVLSDITRMIAEHGINIATVKLSRKTRGEAACCVIETDGKIPADLLRELSGQEDIFRAAVIDLQKDLKSEAEDVRVNRGTSERM